MTTIGRLRICPSDIGRRVSVRFLDADQLTDVLGILDSWKGDWPHGLLQVKKKDDSFQEVISGKILAAKVIEPEIGCLDLERESETTWVPNEKENLGDWVLRYSGNESARANSCRLDGRPENSVDESLLKIIGWYKERKAPAFVQSPKPGAFDDGLKRNNFIEIAHALYMIADTQSFVEENVKVESELSDNWLNAALTSENHRARLSKELLKSGEIVKFASVVNQQNEIIAIGRVSITNKLAMVTTVWVSQNHRNKGLGRQIMNTLSNEAFNLGLEKIVLQVLKSNIPAINLYQSLGYQIHHEYGYYRHNRAQLAPEVNY